MLNIFRSIYEGIPSSIENNRVQSAINDQKERFSKGLVKGFEIEDKTLIQSDTYKLLDKKLAKLKVFRGKPIDFIFSVAGKRIKNNDALLEVTDQIFGNKIYKDAITYDRVSVITYISICDWFLDYAISAVSVMVSEVAYEGHDNPYKNPVDKEQYQFVTSRGNAETFGVICELLFSDFHETMEGVNKMEGITFNPDDVEKQRKQFGASVVDSMRVGFIPVEINPGYWIGQVYNLWHKARHEQVKEDISMLQMKIYRMERIRAGVPEDSKEIADIDGQIEYHADRLSKLKDELEDIESDA